MAAAAPLLWDGGAPGGAPTNTHAEQIHHGPAGAGFSAFPRAATILVKADDALTIFGHATPEVGAAH